MLLTNFFCTDITIIIIIIIIILIIIINLIYIAQFDTNGILTALFWSLPFELYGSYSSETHSLREKESLWVYCQENERLSGSGFLPSYSDHLCCLGTNMLSSTLILPLFCRYTPPRLPSGRAFVSRAEDPRFESRLRRDFFGVESYQWLKNWHSSGYPARRLAL